MRNIFFTVALILSCSAVDAQVSIPADSASKHIGDSVTVCSAVFGIKSLEKLTFINLGAAHPNSPLTIVIFSKDLGHFKATPAELYTNKKVCVTGRLEAFRGKPQIVITKPEEIVVQ
ncbi:MAG: hypothetical protein U0V75_17365 [Ferruginibacter sp.]